MRPTKCVWVSVVLLGCLVAMGAATAEEQTEPKKEIARAVKNGVRVYTPTRVWVGVLDKDAEVEVLLKTGEWCQVQYTKDGSRFVGWVLKEDLVFPGSPPPEKKDDAAPKILSVQETSDQLRELVRVGVAYKTTTGLVPQGKTEMTLDLTGKGTPAKMVVLARFPRSPAVELYVEKKIVELKEFQKIAQPVFDRIITSYIRALQAYNEDRIPDFKTLIERADSFWKIIDSRVE